MNYYDEIKNKLIDNEIYAKVKDKEAKREISDTMTGIIPLKDYSNQ